jgi:hypothetical protein
MKILLSLLLVSFFTTGIAQNSKMNIKNLPNEPLATSSTLLYKATAITTNFTVPLLRFNQLNKAGRDQEGRTGNVAFFNSIGAGISITGGTLRIITDDEGNVIDREMINTIGVQLGFLFAANSATGSNQNVFAPTISLSILNFQMGYGIELGNRGVNERKGFFTLAYGIPVSKLIRGGFYVFRRTPEPIKGNARGFID